MDCKGRECNEGKKNECEGLEFCKLDKRIINLSDNLSDVKTDLLIVKKDIDLLINQMGSIRAKETAIGCRKNGYDCEYLGKKPLTLKPLTFKYFCTEQDPFQEFLNSPEDVYLNCPLKEPINRTKCETCEHRINETWKGLRIGFNCKQIKHEKNTLYQYLGAMYKHCPLKEQSANCSHSYDSNVGHACSKLPLLYSTYGDMMKNCPLKKEPIKELTNAEWEKLDESIHYKISFCGKYIPGAAYQEYLIRKAGTKPDASQLIDLQVENATLKSENERLKKRIKDCEYNQENHSMQIKMIEQKYNNEIERLREENETLRAINAAYIRPAPFLTKEETEDIIACIKDLIHKAVFSKDILTEKMSPILEKLEKELK